MRVETSRGSHLYFKHPGGTIGNRRIGALDVRADRGFVLVPPSIHPTGAVYRAVGRVSEIISLPPAALEALKPPEPASSSTATTNGQPVGSRYVIAAVERECLEVAAQAPDSENRNTQLNKAAWALSRFVADGSACAAPIIEALSAAASHTGLDEREIQKTIRSAFSKRGVPL